MKFKVGDRVKIVANTSNHKFNIGEVVKITHIGSEDYQAFFLDDHDYWFIRDDDAEIFNNLPINDFKSITIVRHKKSVVATISDGVNEYTQHTKLRDADGDYKKSVHMVIDRVIDRFNPESAVKDAVKEAVVADEFNIGDKVTLKKDISGIDTHCISEVTVKRYKNKIFTVKKDFECGGCKFINLNEDNSCFSWNQELFELVSVLFDWDGFKAGKFAVHCDTEENAVEFLKKCDEQGIKWCSGENASDHTNWGTYKGKTTYRFYILLDGRVDSGICYGGNGGSVESIDYIPSKPTVKEVHRPAEVGEWIKIVKATPCSSWGQNYKNGDIFKCAETHACASHDILVAGVNGWIDYKEYNVLENYQPEEPKEEPKPFIKAKVGDLVEIVDDSDSKHMNPPIKKGDRSRIKEVDGISVMDEHNNFFSDHRKRYIIIESAPEKPTMTIKPLSEWTQEELITELFNRQK